MRRYYRAITRLAFHLAKFILRFVDAVMPRLYMRFYLPVLRLYGVRIYGTPRYISTKVKFDDFDQVELHDRVVISEDVTLLTHDYSLTTGLISIDKAPVTDMAFIKPIVIRKNVFIGMNSLILPGTIINENVIIGAGSVVRGTIPKDSIVIGNPASRVASLAEVSTKWANGLNITDTRKD